MQTTCKTMKVIDIVRGKKIIERRKKVKNEKYVKCQTLKINYNTFYVRKNVLSFTFEVDIFCPE